MKNALLRRIARSCLLVGLALPAWMTAQVADLGKEVFTREYSMFLGIESNPPIKEVFSREWSLWVHPGRDEGEAFSREVSLLVDVPGAPRAVTELTMVSSPTGDQLDLDWGTYRPLSVGDVRWFEIYVTAEPMADVTGLTPFARVPGDVTATDLDGLPAFRDAFVSVVPVDGQGQRVTAVTAFGNYVVAREVVSREVTLFTGQEPASPYREVVSREFSLLMSDPNPPPPITDLKATPSATSDSVLLTWPGYNTLAVGDVDHFDVFMSDAPIADVAGMVRTFQVPGDAKEHRIEGLAPGQDRYFAVVPVDGQGNRGTAVSYAGSYPLAGEVVSREYTIFAGNAPLGVASAKEVFSREMTLVVATPEVPAPVTGPGGFLSVAPSAVRPRALDLDWSGYPELANADVTRYRVYAAGSYFTDVSGMMPMAMSSSDARQLTLDGLEPGTSYHVAVVAEDALGQFNPEVRSISATTVPRLQVTIPNLAVTEGQSLEYPIVSTEGSLSVYRFSYALVKGPSGLEVTSAGVLRWTPNETHGAGDHEVEVRVTDNGNPPLVTSHPFIVQVNPGNFRPRIGVLYLREVDEQTTLSYVLPATDRETPNGLSWSLVSGPAGVQVEAATGLLTWTPTEEQGPVDYPTTVRVTDGGGAWSEATFTLRAREVNRAPQVRWLLLSGGTGPAEAGTISIDSPSRIAGAITAIEGNFTPRISTFPTLSGRVVQVSPHDACDMVTNEAELRGNIALVDRRICYFADKIRRLQRAGAIAVIVVNNVEGLVTMGSPDDGPTPDIVIPAVMISLADGDRIKEALAEGVTVTMGKGTVAAGMPVTLQAIASDPDIPSQTLRYSLVEGPAGAVVNPSNGVVTWYANRTGTVTFTVSVTDGSLSATATGSVEVTPVTALPTDVASALGTGTDRGMTWRTHQLATGRENRLSLLEDQLKGLMGPSIHDPTGEVNGRFSISTVNFEQSAAPVGFFRSGAAGAMGVADLLIPGIPGTTGSTDNIAGEAVAYVEFAAAGIYTMGVTSDDGFRVSVGRVGSSNQVILGEFDGSRGSSETTFAFEVTQPGIYPFRLIWMEGGGGADVEWYTVQPDGTRALVNGAQPGALVAYQNAVARQADLVVSELMAPGTAVAGGALTVSWAIQNAGTAAVSTPWTERVYLSKTDSMDGARRLGVWVNGPGSPSGGALAEGARVVNTATFTVPADIEGDWNVLVVTDDAQVVEESNEFNNKIAGATPVTVTPPYPVVFRDDFEGTERPEWSMDRRDATYPALLSRFLGRNGNETVQLTLDGLTPGAEYEATFDLYVIDSWDGSHPTWGPDRFRVLVDGRSLFDQTITSLSWAWDDWDVAPTEIGSLGFNPTWNDSIYRQVKVRFTAGGARAVLGFEGSGLQNLDDESWGIDNVVLWKVAEPDVRANLVVTNVSVPSAAREGEQVAVSWLVTNQGNGVSDADWRVLVGIGSSSDGTAARWLTSVQGPAPLTPGSSVMLSANAIIPPSMDGNRHFVLQVQTAGGETEVLENGDFSTPPVLGAGQTDPAPGEVKPIMTQGDSPLYSWGISGIPGWRYALDAQGFSDHGLANISAFGEPDRSPIAFINWWGTMVSQTHEVSFIPGDRAVARIRFGTLGESGDGGRAGTFYLVAGEADPIHPNTFSPRSTVLKSVVVGNPQFGPVMPEVAVGDGQWASLTLEHEFTGEEAGRPITVAFRLESASEGRAFWDDASLRMNWTHAGSLSSAPIRILMPQPDLSSVMVGAPATALPGVPFEVRWTTRNTGSVEAGAPWQYEVHLSSDSVWGGDLFLASVASNEPLAPGASREVTASVVVPVDGPAGNLYVLVATDTGNAVAESNEADNVGVSAAVVTVPLALTVTGGAASVAENGAALTYTVTRNGDRSADLLVTLASSASTALAVPAGVTIPSGQASTTFAAAPVADGVVTGDRPATLTVGATGFADVTRGVTVTDVDVPRLSLALDASEMGEGASVPARVTRDPVTASPLVVTLVSTAPSQFLLPTTVTIPAGEASVTFAVLTVDDALVEADVATTLTVTAAGHVGASRPLTVVDDDTFTLGLSLAATTFPENAGAAATVGTVTRAPVTSQAVSVALSSSDPTAATVPAWVTIPAGQASVTFNVSAVDDAWSDGNQAVQIGASASLAGRPAVVAAPVTATVTDDDGPMLTLTLGASAAREGASPATLGTVRRNTSTATALVVSLASDNAAEATVPGSVEIPAGAAEATFPVATVADGVTDGSKVARITASALGHESSTASLTVTDADLPDLVVAWVESPGVVETESITSARFRVENRGNVAATGPFIVRLYTSSDAVAGGDTYAAQYTFAGTLPAGGHFELPQGFTAPRRVGAVYLVAEVDPVRAVTELAEDNNAAVSAAVMDVRAAYTAVASTDVSVAMAGTPVPIQGTVTRGDGTPGVGASVTVHVVVRGTRRTLGAIADGLGTFAVNFNPLPGEAGNYEIAAAHPGVSEPPAQDAFTLVGIRIDTAGAMRVIEGQSAASGTRVHNLSAVPVTGLTVEATEVPPGLTVTPSLGSTTLAGNGSVDVAYGVAVADGTTTGGMVRFRVSGSGGITGTFEVPVMVEALRPNLVAIPGSLERGMRRGVQTTVQFDLVNRGGRPTGPLKLLIPPLSWMRVAAGGEVDDLLPGETNPVTVVLTPPANLPLGPYNGSFYAQAEQVGVNVPFTFRSMSEALGTLRVEAVDEFTYYAEGEPRVAGATVVVLDAVTGAEVARQATAANGIAEFAGLREDYYRLEVTADGHGSYRGTHLVEAAKTTAVTAFLPRQTVRYRWTVEPIQVEDRTKITIETVFETSVPVPVVTLEPSVVDLAEVTGNEKQVDLTITNHGLVAANNGRFAMPTHPGWEFIPLITEVGDIPAKSSLTIPMTVRRLGGAGGPCMVQGSLLWDLPCGTLTNTYVVPITFINAAPNCGSAPIAVGGGGGGGGGGGWVAGGPTLVFNPPEISTERCEAVCARVRLKLGQQAVLTRDGFRAVLELENADVSALSDIEVSLRFQDADSADAAERFGVRPPEVSGLGAVDGTGALAANSTGKATWVLIPTRDAAGSEPRVYRVGGTLRYRQNGVLVTVPLADVPITVHPQPLLTLQYFHQRDVYSDDPFTPAVEPSIPYALGILVRNDGFGQARNFRITSSQPQIVENERGLLIDFQLIGTQVAGEEVSPSLTANFGAINAGDIKVGRWLFTSSLQGLFIDYSAKFEHIDSLGNPRLSLIDAVSIHEMIHQVEAQGALADGKPDFLVNDVPDVRDLPDTLYLSQGGTNHVEVVEIASVDSAPSGSDTVVELTATMPAGWAYLRVPEPSDGSMQLTRVVRSDGRELPVDRTWWVTDRTFEGLGRRPTRENILHLLDDDSTGRYTLYYNTPAGEDHVAPSSAVGVLPAQSPRDIGLAWGGTDDASGVAGFDVYVSRDGGPYALWLEGTTLRGALYRGDLGASYRFYSVAFDRSGNREAAPAAADATTTVAFESRGPVVGVIADVGMEPSTTYTGLPYTVTDPDTPLDLLGVTFVSSNPSLLPVEGIVSVGTGPARTLSLTPVPGEHGKADVTMRVTDGTETSVRLFQVTVYRPNRAPLAVDDAVSMTRATSVRIPVATLLGNDTDPDGDTVVVDSVAPFSAAGGRVQLRGLFLVYTPPEGGPATDTFVYTAGDGFRGMTTATVQVTLTDPEPPSGSALSLSSMAATPQSVVLDFVGVKGRRYRIERSANMQPPWTAVGTATADAFGRFRFEDTSPLDPMGFYRIVRATGP